MDREEWILDFKGEQIVYDNMSSRIELENRLELKPSGKQIEGKWTEISSTQSKYV